MEAGLEVAGDEGLGGGEVVVLADVVAQVVELEVVVLEELDELVVPRAHGAAGAPALVAVVWVVPEDGLAFELALAAQQGGNAGAVAVALRLGRQAGVQRLSGAATPGQRTIRGSRVPPSYIQPLPSASGALQVGLPSEGASPPLSEVKTTTVSSAMPSSSSAARTRPMPSSMLCTIAA